MEIDPFYVDYSSLDAQSRRNTLLFVSACTEAGGTIVGRGRQTAARHKRVRRDQPHPNPHETGNRRPAHAN
jgi:hypothetical protein